MFQNELRYRKGYFQAQKFLALKTMCFWGKGKNPMPPLNNFSDFWEKNSNFCDFKKGYTIRVSMQYEKKYRRF